MFDLEKEIAEWRSKLTRSSEMPRKAIVELEGHLRDSIESRSAEQSNEEAFNGAVAELGSNEQIITEFRKSNGLIPFDYFVFWMGLAFLGWSLLDSINDVSTRVLEGRQFWLGSLPIVTLVLMDLLGGYGILRLLSLKYEGDVFRRKYEVCIKTLIHTVGFCFISISVLWLYRRMPDYDIGDTRVLVMFGLTTVLIATCIYILSAKLSSIRLGQVGVGLSAIIIAFPYFSSGPSEAVVLVFCVHILLVLLPVFLSKSDSNDQDRIVA